MKFSSRRFERNRALPEKQIMSTELLKEQIVGDGRAHAAFAGLVILSILVFWKALHELVVFSLNQESSSHILLIPLVSAYLLYSERSRIFRLVQPSPYAGSAVVLAAVAMYVFAVSWLASRKPDEFLSAATLAIVAVWLGGFLLCYGSSAWRRASFSLLFLLLMVPLPPPVLERSIFRCSKARQKLPTCCSRLWEFRCCARDSSSPFQAWQSRWRKNVAVFGRAWRCLLPVCSRPICFCERSGEC